MVVHGTYFLILVQATRRQGQESGRRDAFCVKEFAEKDLDH